ncbi:MAG TPA: TIGR04211 family SH3 domain-containing protein [Pseudomonadales bacterium]|nr:TIGR04211 family SH3 domain-containing protein [Pseudomonadales bacterium]
MSARALLCLAALLSASVSRAETVWISDEFTVPLRSGPSNEHRIIHRGLPSGTELQVLGVDTAAGYTHVRTSGDLDGWISSQYLVKEPIARIQLVTANNKIQALDKQLAQRNESLSELRSTSSEAASNGDRLAAQVAQLEAELAELKRVSADAIGEHTRNQELNSLNERLRAEVEDLTEESQRLEDNTQQRWLLTGGVLVIGGLLAGVAIKARPRRSGWS